MAFLTHRAKQAHPFRGVSPSMKRDPLWEVKRRTKAFADWKASSPASKHLGPGWMQISGNHNAVNHIVTSQCRSMSAAALSRSGQMTTPNWGCRLPQPLSATSSSSTPRTLARSRRAAQKTIAKKAKSNGEHWQKYYDI